MENFRVTIEAVSEDARKQMGGARVYDCDNVLLLAGKPVDIQEKGVRALEMRCGVVGSMKQVGRMYVQLMDTMTDELRVAIAAAIIEKRTGRMTGEQVYDEPYGPGFDAETLHEQMDEMLAELLRDGKD